MNIPRWCRSQYLFGSQIPVTTGVFELRISCIRSSHLTLVVTGICDPSKSWARHHRSVKLGSKLKYLNYEYNKKVKFILNLMYQRIWYVPRSKTTNKRKLTWFGHLLRLSSETPARKALRIYKTSAKKPTGKPKTNW